MTKRNWKLNPVSRVNKEETSEPPESDVVESKRAASRRAAIYVRVSKESQRLDLQLDDLNAYALEHGYTVYNIYKDHGKSGAKKNRKGLGALLSDAKAGKFSHVLVWKWDRLSRDMRHMLESYDLLKKLGIEIISTQNKIDTSTPTGKFMFHVICAMAEFERGLDGERIKAGMRAAMKRGVKMGADRQIDYNEVYKLRALGMTMRAIASQLSISHSQVHVILKGVQS